MNATARKAREQRIDEAAAALRDLAGPAPRPLIVVSGSGLAAAAAVVSVERRIPLDRLPHVPRPTVAGHPGTLVVGRIGSLGTLFFAGRLHPYEGLPAGDVVFPVDLGRRLGGKILLATNASGGVAPLLRPGDLMMLTGHLDLTFRNPLIGARSRIQEPTRTGGGNPYDTDLCALLREAALREKIDLKEGIYAATFGPSYETKAESEMLRAMGADAVGMSTVPEVLAARRAGFRVVAVSCIANRVPAWGRASKVTHAQVVERMSAASRQLKRLIARWVEMVEDNACG